ncbi:MAG: YfcE family phosphodiesterase [Candidatus Hermodarchaeota archaeon]
MTIRCLAIGDSHIPRRAKEIPDKIMDKINHLTTEELFDYTFFTGDLISAYDFIDYLNLKTKKKLFIVIGNMDYFGGNRNAPMYQNLLLNFLDGEKLSIGLTHGHQIQPRGDHSQLDYLARIEKNYHILISGHTHKEEVYLTKNGRLLVNPGSVTGAWSFIASGIPSFIVLHVNEENKEIVVSLNQFDKEDINIIELKSYFIFQNNQINYKY